MAEVVRFVTPDASIKDIDTAVFRLFETTLEVIKLKKYEDAIPADKKGDYRSLTEDQTRALRLEYSRFFVFGGEESYGYLGSDSVRDKDANGATLMFAEVAAYAKSVGKTLPGLLDELYEQFGYFLEVGKSLTMEGA